MSLPVTVATVTLALTCAVALIALYHAVVACTKAIRIRRRLRLARDSALPAWAVESSTSERSTVALIATPHTASGSDLPFWVGSGDSRAPTPPFAWQSLHPVTLPQSGSGPGADVLGLFQADASDDRLPPSPPPSPPRGILLRHFSSSQSLILVPARGRVNIDPMFSDSGSSDGESSTSSGTRARFRADEYGEHSIPVAYPGISPDVVGGNDGNEGYASDVDLSGDEGHAPERYH
ncbi:hypothetical protein AURDEDRAFT_117772, partial [Auricularia subglabra TFB-10046 SS5]